MTIERTIATCERMARNNTRMPVRERLALLEAARLMRSVIDLAVIVDIGNVLDVRERHGERRAS